MLYTKEFNFVIFFVGDGLMRKGTGHARSPLFMDIFHILYIQLQSLYYKLDYCNTVFHPLPEYQIKPLQRVQNTYAAFVLRLHAKLSDVKNLNWLPIRERIELSLLKMTHTCKSLY